MRTLTVFKLLVIACMLTVFTACGRESGPQAETSRKTPVGKHKYTTDVVRLEGGDWGYPTPYAHYPRGPGGYKMCLIFDSLLERDEQGLIPWLAEKYEIRDNGGLYVFTVREGLRWQDGKPLTAEDVRFSIDYATRHPMTWSYIFDAIASVETGPGNTVKVIAKKPAASMLYNLGMTRIIPKHVWEKIERPKEFTAPEAVIGSGPYRLTGYSKEHGTYRFEAFADFWGPRQRVRRIEFVPVSEPVLAYENKEISLTRISPDLLSRFEKDPENRIVKSPAFWGYRLLFNMRTAPPLADKTVRQAIAHAIDLDELISKIARGAGVPGRAGILPPDHIMAADDIKIYAFDPRKANSLLEFAGYRQTGHAGPRIGQTGKPLMFELLCSSKEVRMAEIIRQRLAEVGIQIRIKSVDPKSRDTFVRNNEYRLAIIGHGGWGRDPEYLAEHFRSEAASRTTSPSASGLSGFDVPALTALLKQQEIEFDPAKRKSLLREIQQLAAEQVPELPLFYTTAYSVYRPAEYDGWMFMYDHHHMPHSKLSYLKRPAEAAIGNDT